jgi:hypothetical protein
MYGTEENPMCEVESLINGLIMTDGTRCFKAGGNYGNSYMGMLANCTMAQIQCESTLLYKTISAEDEYEQYDNVREYMFQQCLLYSLYKTIETGMSTDYFGELDSTYESGNQTFKITDLKYNKIDNEFTMKLGLYEKDSDGEYNMLVAKSYREYERINMTDLQKEKCENGEIGYYERATLKVNLDTSLSSKNNTDFNIKYTEAYEEMELKQIEALYDMTMSMFTAAKLFPDDAVSIIDFMSGVFKADGSPDYLSSICGATNIIIGGDSDDSDGSVLSLNESSSEYTSVLAKYAYEYYTAREEYEKIKETLSSDYKKYTMGIGLKGKVKSDIVLSDSGIYDPYTILSIKKYEQKGLNGYADDIDGIANYIGYVKDSKNYGEFQDNYQDKVYKDGINLDELSECLDYLLYGNDPDGDGNIDYNKDLWDYDPRILNLAIDEIGEKDGKTCLEYATGDFDS